MSSPRFPTKDSAMATQYVTYKSSTLLSCRCDENAAVIICLDPALTYNGAPVINGTLLSYTEGADVCGNTLYSYYISYDDTLLLDPSSLLISSQIRGIVCRGCLTTYIDYWIGGGGGAPSNFHFITNEQQLIDFQSAPGSQGIVIQSFSLTQNVTCVKPLFIIENNQITCTGFVLTFNGTFNAGTYKCFNAVSGEVLFKENSTDNIYTEWFGSISDGVTDSTIAIQTALDSALFTSVLAEYGGGLGNEVKLLPGRYIVTDTIVVPTNVWLSGTDQVGTIVQASGLSSGQAVIKFKSAAAGQTHSTIKNLTVSGSNIVGIVGIDFFEWVSGSTQNNFSRVIDCSIVRCTIGMKLDSRAVGKYIIYDKIQGCTFEQANANFTHILVSRGVNYLTIENNHFYGTDGYALHTDNTFFGSYIDFTGNSIDVGNSKDWASVKINCVAGVQGVAAIITRNRFEGAGIYVSNLYASVQILDNYITEARRGIYHNGRDSLIANNWIFLKEVNDIVGYEYGIELGPNSSLNHIGINSFGDVGETSFSPTKVKYAGFDNIIDHEYHIGTTQNGTHELADIVNSAACTVGSTQQWVVTEAGSLRGGTGPTTGDVNGGDLYRIVNVASVVGYSRGTYITISGCTGFYKIKGSFGGNTLLLTTPASNASLGATIAIKVPLFKMLTYPLKVGTTASRPTPSVWDSGMMYMDTTLDPDGMPIWWNGSKWIKADGYDPSILLFNTFYLVHNETELATASADANCKKIVIVEAFGITGNTTITKDFIILKGCPITTNGFNLNINGTFTAPAYQCFIASSGNVNFAAASISEIPVEWFGAVGNGVTDDTTAIQTAIDAGADTGCQFTVRLAPTKTYNITSITITGRVCFKGNERSTTAPTLSGTAAGVMVTLSTPTIDSHIKITGIRFNGNNTATTIIDVNNNHNVIIENCYFVQCILGIDHSAGGENNKIYKNDFTLINVGILFSGVSVWCVVSENVWTSSAAVYAIHFNTTMTGYHIDILNNTFRATGATNHILFDAVGGYQGLMSTIERNYFGSVSTDALISVGKEVQVIIRDNTFRAIQNHHLAIDGNYVVVSNNLFMASTAAAIDLTANSTACNIGLQQWGAGGVICAADIADAGTLNYIERIPLRGATGSRPTLLASEVAKMYMDTTLDADGLPIWWNGAKWIKADGSDA